MRDSKSRPPAGSHPAFGGALLRPAAADFSSIHNHSAYALIERDKTKSA